MTANILTPGHIKCLDYLTKKDSVIVGLLTSKALKGYKEELVPYKDREFVLDHVDVYGFAIVPQDSLDPSKNIQEYECDAIASGDGWEKVELGAIKKLKLKKIDIKLPGEKKKKYSSRKIWQKKF